MQEYYVNCVRKDRYDIITHVGIGGNLYEVREVAQGLNNKQYRAYTFMNGYKAYISPRISENGNWFLITSPDGITENNLGFLPTC